MDLHDELRNRIEAVVAATEERLADFGPDRMLDQIILEKNTVIDALRANKRELKSTIQELRQRGQPAVRDSQVEELRSALDAKRRLCQELQARIANELQPELKYYQSVLAQQEQELQARWTRISEEPAVRAEPASAAVLIAEDSFAQNWQTTNAHLEPAATWFKRDGTETNPSAADALTESPTAAVHGIYRDVPQRPGDCLEFSFYVKPSGRTYLGVWMGAIGHSVLAEGFYDLTRAVPLRDRKVGRIRDFRITARPAHAGWLQVALAARLPEFESDLRLQVNLRNTESGSSRYPGEAGSGVFIREPTLSSLRST